MNKEKIKKYEETLRKKLKDLLLDENKIKDAKICFKNNKKPYLYDGLLKIDNNNKIEEIYFEVDHFINEKNEPEQVINLLIKEKIIPEFDKRKIWHVNF